jgi:hypothetical protein
MTLPKLSPAGGQGKIPLHAEVFPLSKPLAKRVSS